MKGDCGSKTSKHYTIIMELPINPFIPSRYLLRCYERLWVERRSDCLPVNQARHYMQNDPDKRWRENAFVIEQRAKTCSLYGYHLRMSGRI